jgi:predicted nucleic acid-binding protein
VNNVRYGILDTCVFIDVDKIEASALPDESYVTTISLAELAAGPHAAQDPNERAQRQDRLQRVETTFEALPFDASAARAYGRVYALELAGGRKPRGARTMDLLIAAIAVAENLTLYTRNPEDFESLTSILNIIVV